MATSAPALLSSAAPVLKVDGAVVGDLARDLLRLEVEEGLGGLRTLRAHLVGSADREGTRADVSEYLDGEPLALGARLEVSVGEPTGEQVVFEGTLSAIEATFESGDVPSVAVFAEDALMSLRLTQRSRTYRRASEADIARQIAGEHGLTPVIDADGPTYDVVQQASQSDLAFLRGRGELIAAELWAAGKELHLATRDNRRGPELALTNGSDLVAVAIRADLAHQCAGVRVSGYDAARRDRIDEEAPGSAVRSEVSAGRTGPEVLSQALGDRACHMATLAPLTAGEARAWARAELLRRARRFVSVLGVTTGSPAMTVGSRVELRGVGAPFQGGGYYVTRVVHSYDLVRGARTRFEAERATMGEGGA